MGWWVDFDMKWKDFKKRQSELPNTTKVGNEFEKLVKIYFKIINLIMIFFLMHGY